MVSEFWKIWNYTDQHVAGLYRDCMHGQLHRSCSRFVLVNYTDHVAGLYWSTTHKSTTYNMSWSTQPLQLGYKVTTFVWTLNVLKTSNKIVFLSPHASTFPWLHHYIAIDFVCNIQWLINSTLSFPQLYFFLSVSWHPNGRSLIMPLYTLLNIFNI